MESENSKQLGSELYVAACAPLKCMHICRRFVTHPPLSDTNCWGLLNSGSQPLGMGINSPTLYGLLPIRYSSNTLYHCLPANKLHMYTVNGLGPTGRV